MGVSYRRADSTLQVTISRRALTLAVVALHGPLDVGLTLAAFHLEGNPLVAQLGPTAWVGVKIAALLALPVALYGVDREPWLPGDRLVDEHADVIAAALLALTLLLGVALVIPNLAILAARGGV